MMAVFGRLRAVVGRMPNVMGVMFCVFSGVMSGRLMMRLRSLFLGKGHHRAVCQAHEAEQRGNDDPETWAKGPKRSHASI